MDISEKGQFIFIRSHYPPGAMLNRLLKRFFPQTLSKWMGEDDSLSIMPSDPQRFGGGWPNND